MLNGLDGALKAWSIQVQVLASGKVGVGGGLILKNLLDPPYVCGPSVVGTVYYDTKNDAIRYCSAGGWRGLADTCGNGKVESNEECDDGNNTDSDGCSSNCVASAGFAQAKPGTSCKNVMALAKAESVNTADGLYWLKAGADPAFQAWCDMTRDSGGWTLVFRLAETNWDHNNADNAPPTPTKTKAKFASAVINQISGQKAGNAYELRLEGPVTSTLMQASEPFYVEMNTAQVTVKYDCNRDGTYEKSKTWNSWTVDRGAGEGASWVRDWVFPQNGQCNAWNGGNVMEYWGGTATTPVTSAKPISATAGAYTHDGSIFVWVR
jgi:cysteine-rich repeat protein